MATTAKARTTRRTSKDAEPVSKQTTANPASVPEAKRVVDIWTREINPLRNLTAYQIEMLLDNARLGDDIKLQLAYYEIERSTPIFSVCISKRLSGMQNRQWSITTLDNSAEAKVQQKKIQEMFNKADTRNEDGLTEALRHLDMATFRGRSAVKPFIDDNGNLFFKKLNNWNFVRWNGKSYWNPEGNQVPMAQMEDFVAAGLVEIPEGEVAYLVDDKCLDWCGITIYLRQLIGEDNWARAVEKFGIPQVLLTAPEGTPDTALDIWNWRAKQIFEGGSGSLPNGTKVDVLTEARGQDPFSLYIQHQMEQFSILATGGTLATLGGSSGLGSNLADVQNDQFQSLVSYDCKRIQNAMQIVVDKCVRYIYGDNANSLVRFEFVEQDQTKPMEYLELAKKATELGLKIDIQKLKQLTNLDFISDEENELWSPETSDGGEDNK